MVVMGCCLLAFLPREDPPPCARWLAWRVQSHPPTRRAPGPTQHKQHQSQMPAHVRGEGAVGGNGDQSRLESLLLATHRVRTASSGSRVTNDSKRKRKRRGEEGRRKFAAASGDRHVMKGSIPTDGMLQDVRGTALAFAGLSERRRQRWCVRQRFGRRYHKSFVRGPCDLVTRRAWTGRPISKTVRLPLLCHHRRAEHPCGLLAWIVCRLPNFLSSCRASHQSVLVIGSRIVIGSSLEPPVRFGVSILTDPSPFLSSL